MAIAFGKHGDVSDHNMPYSFIKKVKKKIKGIPVWFGGMAKTFWSVFNCWEAKTFGAVSGLAGVVSVASVFSGSQASGSYEAFYVGEAKNSVTIFFAGGAA